MIILEILLFSNTPQHAAALEVVLGGVFFVTFIIIIFLNLIYDYGGCESGSNEAQTQKCLATLSN